jgi:hypothetical protein
MQITILFRHSATVSLVVLFLSACSTPTLVEIARTRQATPAGRKASQNIRDDVRIKYGVAPTSVGTSSGERGSPNPHGGGSDTPPVIPEQLRPRNARLENAFKFLSPDDAKKRLQDKGKFPPEGVTPKEYLAKVLLADADLPLLENHTAVDSLAFYRRHAVDETATAKLEKAFRDYRIPPFVEPEA